MAAHSESFFATKLADFDYDANSIGVLLSRLQDLEAAYDNSSSVQSVAKLIEKVLNYEKPFTFEKKSYIFTK